MKNSMHEDGKCIVVTAPSGAGKTTIVKHLLHTYPHKLGFSVSATTRSPRKGEKDGKDYYFLSRDRFRKKIEEGDFVEYEEVYSGQYYGTLKTELNRLWEQGRAILFDIDVQGALTIKKQLGDQCLTVFVKPPSEEILIQRLTDRQTESEEAIRLRVAKIKEELSFENCFDRVLVNDVLERTLEEANRLTEAFLGIGKE